MNSIESYRLNAQECLRLASLERNEHDKPLWVTLAQSWLRLAEHADRLTPDTEPERELSSAENGLARE